MKHDIDPATWRCRRCALHAIDVTTLGQHACAGRAYDDHDKERGRAVAEAIARQSAA